MPTTTKGGRLKTEEVKKRLLIVHKLIKEDGLHITDACKEQEVATTSYNRYLSRGFFKTAAATAARMERKALRDEAQNQDTDDALPSRPASRPASRKGNGRRTSKRRRDMRRYTPEEAKRLVAEVKRLTSGHLPSEDRLSILNACEQVDIGLSTYHRYKGIPVQEASALEPVITETKLPSTTEEFLKHEIQRLNHRIEAIQMTNLKLIQCVAQSID